MSEQNYVAGLLSLTTRLTQSAQWQSFYQKLPKLLTLLLTVLVLYSLANLTWLLIPQPTLHAYQAINTPQKLAVQTHVKAQAAKISDWHLFGKAQAITLAQNPIIKTDNLKDTNLDLTLKGITYSAHEKESFAIIADNQGNEKNYKINDTLPGNAKIEKILLNSVILIHNAERVKLQFKKSDDSLQRLSNANAQSKLKH